MAAVKFDSHRVTLNERRRDLKKKNDIMSTGISKDVLQHIFDNYYRDQVRALYRAVSRKS